MIIEDQQIILKHQCTLCVTKNCPTLDCKEVSKCTPRIIFCTIDCIRDGFDSDNTVKVIRLTMLVFQCYSRDG